MKDSEKILTKLRNMKKYVDFLKSFKDISKEKLNEDYILRSAIERNFQLALESALDIGEIIISMKDLEKPEDYKDIMEILGKAKILPRDFAKEFAPTAGFRNILVHKYTDVDTDELYEHLKHDLKDFDFFAECIAKFIKTIM
jgi:uncharacterized protein YutE (UPF0331/DUF86 family)